MVDYDRVQDFLEAHDMEPERVDPKREAALMLEDMRRGLAGEKSDMPMIPTYLSNDAQLPLGRSVAVIDAGGTNFRSALVRFEEDGCHVSELSKCRMPGVGEPCTWEEFISFVADRIEPLMGRAESIGFCFSYSADITPDMDGRVIRIDKEVVVTGSEGKLIGASLRALSAAESPASASSFLMTLSPFCSAARQGWISARTAASSVRSAAQARTPASPCRSALSASSGAVKSAA